MLVDRFFVWVAEASVDQRLRAVDLLVRAHVSRSSCDDEREALEAALTLVAEDPDPAVRRALAERLAVTDAAPRHILLGLVWDHPDVAEPIAARSDDLIDAELVDLAAGAHPRIQIAVARRRRVAATVATALAEAADRPAALALLANPGADIPAAALERLVDRFGEFADLREALMTRPHVPITVRHRVLEKLAEAMGNLVVVRDWMRSERADAVTRDARDKATVTLAATAGDGEVVVLVEHLRRTGQLTTRLMLRAACVGAMRFVEEALAALAGQPSARVAGLVADGRESAFRALYARAGMPDRAFPAFAAALDVHRALLRETGGLDGRPGDRARFARRLIERVLTRYGALDRRDGDDLMALLRRFAADAARDHARSVVAERTAELNRTLALAAPVAAPAEAVDADIDERDAGGRLDVVPRSATRAHADDARLEAVVAAALADVDLAAAAPPHLGEAAADDEPIGLFSHVDLDDVPPEWLSIDDVSSTPSWGDADLLRPAFAAAAGEPPVDVAPFALDAGLRLRGGLDLSRAA